MMSVLDILRFSFYIAVVLSLVDSIIDYWRLRIPVPVTTCMSFLVATASQSLLIVLAQNGLIDHELSRALVTMAWGIAAAVLIVGGLNNGLNGAHAEGANGRTTEKTS